MVICNYFAKQDPTRLFQILPADQIALRTLRGINISRSKQNARRPEMITSEIVIFREDRISGNHHAKIDRR
jgi:hypothetical protein